MSEGSLLNGYVVVTCEDCGFCFADEIPSQTAFDEYYESMSKYEHLDRSGHDSDDDQRRFLQVYAMIRPFLRDHQSRILEIGCANGGLLALFKQEGFTNLLGVDPSPMSASVARTLHGIRVITANLSNLPLPGQYFDFVVLVGVLEHVRDLDLVVDLLRELLSLTGQLDIVVPDASRYTDGEDAPFQEFSVEHINYFGPKSLGNLFRTRGFVMQHCEQKRMDVGHRTSTPVVHAVFQKTPASTNKPVVLHDEETAVGLATYIAASQEVDARIRAIVDGVVKDYQQPIIVWGAGAHTLRLLETSRLKEAKITAFVDSNPRYQGKILNGVPIVTPGDLRGHSEPILISSRAYQEEIASYIRDDLKLHNQVIRLYDLAGDGARKAFAT